MKVTPSKLFRKHYVHLGANQKVTFQTRIDLFLANPAHPILHNHPLHGKYEGSRSLNIGGDIRLIFEYASSEEVRLIDIGTHAQLYE